jgi:imidazolonepropionase-like amidohydrolase
MNRSLVVFLLLSGHLVLGQNKSVLLMNGFAHLGNGKVIENSVIGIKDGKIVLVADARMVKLRGSAFDTVIHIEGKQVYPGIIAPNTTIGLSEIESVRGSNDFAEVGLMNPNVRSQVAYNTDSKIIPTIRCNGVLIAQVCPRQGMLSGTSSIFEMDGWNWEDALIKGDDGIQLNFPHLPIEKMPVDPLLPARKTMYTRQLQELKKFFLDAKAYHESGSHQEKNIRFEAMKGVFDGSQRLYIHVDYAKDILEALAFIKENGIQYPVIVGAKDSWLVTGILKESNVPVMLGRVHELPMRPDDDIDMPYKLPFLLQKAGILFCLQNAGDMEVMNSRNLPFLAGTAEAYGLTKEEALMSITLNAARILGIDKILGSIENGKDATLFISDGDALDMRSNCVEMIFIKGKRINLDNEQKELYQTYKRKYGLK